MNDVTSNISPEVLLKQLSDSSGTEDFMSQLPGVINRDCIRPICEKLQESPDFETADTLDDYIEGVVSPSLRHCLFLMSLMMHSNETEGGPAIDDAETRWAIEDFKNLMAEYLSMYYEISLSALKAVKKLVADKEGGVR